MALMHIGLAGPITLSPLRALVSTAGSLPDAYSFPNTTSLALELHRRGHEVSVFALSSTTSVPSCHTGERMTIHVVPMRVRAKDRARDLFAAERNGLAAAMVSEPCDVLHAHWTYEFALGAEQTDMPVVVTAHDAPLSVARLNRHPYWWIRAGMALPAIHRATWLTSVSPAVASQIRRLYGYRRDVPIVPNGIPNEIFGAYVETRTAGAAPTFVSVAQGWGRLKNTQAAIVALANVRRQHPNTRLILFGAGHGMHEEAHRFATEIRATEGCDFRGVVPREEVIGALTERPTALVHPSRWEAHSVAISEAMALGVPVIGGHRSGGVPWTLGHGSAGVLVDITDAQALSAAMVDLIENPSRGAEIGARARSHAQDHYSMASVVDQYEMVYRDACSRWSRSRGSSGGGRVRR